MSRIRASVLLALSGLLLVPLLGLGGPATATTSQSVVVSDDPVDNTPHVLDGRVNTVVQLGDRVLLAGDFTKARRQGSSTVVDRDNAMVFSASTGAIDAAFTPSFDGVVEQAVAHPDGRHVFLVGSFNTVDGQGHRKIVKLDIVTGEVVSSFDPDADSKVLDAALSGSRLFLGGSFDSIDGVPRAAFAAVDITTGVVDPSVHVPFEEAPVGSTSVRDIDVTGDGSRLVAVGNFDKVGGQPRNQAAVLQISSSGASVANWATSRFAPDCSTAFDSPMRSVDIGPDGTWFVVSTTGAYSGGPPKLCDSVSRWALQASGTDIQPDWAAYPGGDTTYTVLATGAAVYVGGHMRWQNNPYAGDRQGPGAVPREGIAALDPDNGVPFSWNPGRSRGVGVFDFLATGSGLWVASDTDRLGGETHARIGFFPIAGGTTPPDARSYALPGDLYDVLPNGKVRRHFFDGDSAGASLRVPKLTMPDTRGAFALGGRILSGTAQGTLLTRRFNGTRDRAIAGVDLHGLQEPPNRPIPGTSDPIPGYDQHLRSTTGMFWTRGFLYYTVRDQSRLYVRAYSPQARIVGAELALAGDASDPVPWAQVRGMTFSEDTLFYATADDRLWSVPFQDGRVTGSPRAIGGPGIDGYAWASRALFVFPG